MWKSGNLGIWESVGLGLLLLDPQPAARYRAVVAQFASAPHAAVEQMLAMPASDVSSAVRDAVRADSGWSAAELNRALLMHGEAAIALSENGAGAVPAQIDHADALAMAAASRAGNEYFVHRWCKAFTSRIPAKAIEDHWRRQGWFQTAAAIDRARQLEMDGGQVAMPVDVEIYDPTPLRQAIPLFEQGVAAHFLVAAVHLGRIQMLRGHEIEARRLLTSAAADEVSPVNRYLANLFLGSFDERENDREGAERHYRAAVASLPRAQSGRVALSVFLERTGRAAEARAAIAGGGAFYDPWWSYFRATGRETAIIFAELRAEVSR